MSIKIPELKEMMKAGLHFGHKSSKWHPNMKDYIYGVKNGVHIFDLEETKKSLEKALEAVKDTVKNGGIVLFLGTQKQIHHLTEKYAEEAEMPYVNNAWIGGTITNFHEIRKLVDKLDKLEGQSKADDYEKKYTKKERSLFDEEMQKLNNQIGGIRNLKGLPDLIFIMGVKHEKTAMREANRKKIKIVGVCDTNADPKSVTHPIFANDDAIKSVNLVAGLVTQAIKTGKTEQLQAKSEDESIKKDNSNGEL